MDGTKRPLATGAVCLLAEYRRDNRNLSIVKHFMRNWLSLGSLKRRKRDPLLCFEAPSRLAWITRKTMKCRKQ